MAYRAFILGAQVVLRLPATAGVLLNHSDTQMPALKSHSAPRLQPTVSRCACKSAEAAGPLLRRVRGLAQRAATWQATPPPPHTHSLTQYLGDFVRCCSPECLSVTITLLLPGQPCFPASLVSMFPCLPGYICSPSLSTRKHLFRQPRRRERAAEFVRSPLLFAQSSICRLFLFFFFLFFFGDSRCCSKRSLPAY